MSIRISLALILVCGMLGCGGDKTPTTPTPPISPAPPQPPTPNPEPPQPTPVPPTFTPTGQTVQVVAVGDIGMCTQREAVEQVARLVEGLPGLLLLAGDLAYMQGSLANFRDCFDPSWGKFRNRWRPVPGNHEYETPGASGYRQYFGDQEGAIGRTYYSFRTGDWLVLMLDSNESMQSGSQQYAFVQTALANTRSPCALAMWHHPLFTSGPNGPNPNVREMWRLLYDHGVEVIINGHDHLYERFAKQDQNGRADPTKGIREFIVGTGGATLYDFQRVEVNQQSRWKGHGALHLTLTPSGYAWQFVEASTNAVRDSNSEGCH